MLDDTDIAIAGFIKPLVADVIVYLLVNIQRFLRMLMPFHPLPQPLFSEVPKPLYPEGFWCHLWVEITKLWYRVDLGGVCRSRFPKFVFQGQFGKGEEGKYSCAPHPTPFANLHWPGGAVLQGSSSAEPLLSQQPPLEHSGLQVLDTVTKSGCRLSAPASWQSRVRNVV